MPELRRDPVVGRWIIISKERGKRPTDFLIEEPKVASGFCPLCPGNENTTPPEVLSFREVEDGGRDCPGWQVRVVPNKYPALVIEGNLDKEGEGLYDKMNGIGAHEVIVESPNHGEPFGIIPPERMLKVFMAYRQRIADLAQDERFKYVMIFKNHGKAAGASLEHSHSQLIALPILPKMLVTEIEGGMSYYKYKERCVFCDIIRQEIKQDVRVVCQNEHFITITPFAPRTPFEMWVLPKEHTSSFRRADDERLYALARLFSETLRRLNSCIPGVPYNFLLHTAPLRTETMAHFHYHFEIVPKLTSIAGFEWGSGFYINPMPPEEAAIYLRESLEEK